MAGLSKEQAILLLEVLPTARLVGGQVFAFVDAVMALQAIAKDEPGSATPQCGGDNPLARHESDVP